MSVYSDLRRQYPFLTPPFAGDDDDPAAPAPAQPLKWLRGPQPTMADRAMSTATPSDIRPRTVVPGFQSDQRDVTVDSPFGEVRKRTVAPPPPPGYPAGADPNAPIAQGPVDLNGTMPQMRPQQPMPPQPSRGDETRSWRAYPTTPHIDSATGKPTPGLNSVGRKLEEIRAMRENPRSEVTTDTAGNINVAPPTKPGRGKQALMGLLYGALEGAKVAGWKGAIGGAATGGITGAISPNLIAAMTRDMDISRKQGAVDQEQSALLKQSQIDENRAQAQRARQGTPHYSVDADGVQRVTYDNVSQPVRDRDTGEPVTGKDPDAETEHQRLTREALERYRQAQIEARKKAAEQKEKEKVDVTVGGKKYRVSQSAAASIAQRQQAAKQRARKADPAVEAEYEAIIHNDAEKSALENRRKADEKIAALRAERDKLTHRSTPPRPGVAIDPNDPNRGYGWEEDARMVKKNAARIEAIDREIADWDEDSKAHQRVAEKAAEDKRKAEAKVRAGGGQVNWSGGSKGSAPARGARKQFNLGAWKADHPNATPAEVEAKRKQYTDQNFIIVE